MSKRSHLGVAGSLGAAVLWSLAAAGPAACGGKVVVDDEDAASGTGSGGAGAGSSSSTGASGGDPTSASSSSSSSSSASSASAGGAPVICEDEGSCLDCFECANASPCATEVGACDASPDCAAFQQCTIDCQVIGTEECLAKCIGDNPGGWVLYDAWISCSACTVCPSSCAVAFSFFCPQPL